MSIITVKMRQLALRGIGSKELHNKNAYIWSGFGLVIAGSLVTLPAFFILQLTWLTALGLCMIILSLILLALGNTVPKLPPEVCRLLLETGTNNIAALIEELGISTKAIYLPPSLNSGQVKAFIPLRPTPAPPG